MAVTSILAERGKDSMTSSTVRLELVSLAITMACLRQLVSPDLPPITKRMFADCFIRITPGCYLTGTDHPVVLDTVFAKFVLDFDYRTAMLQNDDRPIGWRHRPGALDKGDIYRPTSGDDTSAGGRTWDIVMVFSTDTVAESGNRTQLAILRSRRTGRSASGRSLRAPRRP